MTKEQEAHLKYLMLSSNIKLDKEDFEFKKDVLKKTIPMFPMIMNEPIPDTNYIDELDYETYLKWIEEHIEFINERYYDLNDRINSVVRLYFDKEDVSYTAKEVKKILSNTINMKLVIIILSFNIFRSNKDLEELKKYENT